MTAAALEDVVTLVPVPDLVRVVVLADDTLTHGGIAGALEDAPGVRVVPDREAGRADVVVCAAETGAEAAALVQRALRGGAARAVAVAGRLGDAGLLALVDAGASAVLRRSDADAASLAAAVRAAHAGDGSLPADLVGRLLGHLQRLGRDVLAPRGLSATGLTAREREVLAMLADGADTKAIARELRHSERTVKNIVHDLTTRLGALNRTHVVACALRAGLIS